jgi:hypothetical protein
MIMRLLEIKDDGDFSLAEFISGETPPYAILLPTWGVVGEEITLKDLPEDNAKRKDGYQKLRFRGDQAAADGLQ